MYIESQNVSLMQAAHQAARTPQTTVPPTTGVAQPTAPAPKAAPEPEIEQVRAASESRRRLAIAEKILGTNKSLIIEKDSQRVGFVYKTIDKATGEVVRVWPQREVASALQALADPDARATISGMMVDAKA